jgi:hypothetical protein
MCVYCSGASECDHERDACGESRRALHRLRARLRGVPAISARAKTHDVMVPEGTSAQAKAADGGGSGTPGEGEQEGSMSYSTENFVRRAVVGLFRGEYAGKFLCSGCLITLTHLRMQRGWRKSEIERSMEAVFKSPEPLTRVPTSICAVCQKTTPCLGALRP